MSWLKKGLEGSHHENAEMEQKKDRKPFRFFLRMNEEKKIVLLDEEGVFFFEHLIKLDHTPTKGLDEFVCGKGFNDENDPGCYLCDMGYRRSWTGLLTCVVLTPEYGRDGTEYKNSVRAFPLTKKTRNRFITYRKRLGTLVGIPIICSRTSKQSPSVGDDFQLLKEEKMDPFTDPLVAREGWDGGLIHPEVIDYELFYRPKSNKEMKRIINDGMEEQWDSGHVANASETPLNNIDEDIPF